MRFRRLFSIARAGSSFGSHDVALDQCIKRLQGGCAGANLVGQRRHTQIDAFAPVSFALAVQRLMLAELSVDMRPRIDSISFVTSLGFPFTTQPPSLSAV